ncbi:hypothetical protein Cni_G04426 [Canna indica]|uniref:Uncharacterized protein n=1 Tax=Canna indica TaxID=4628 RepID=A0AAQ3JSW9_9LILI|nr:hypothetical protein Cni_G04426 [Canna indica]
MAARSVTVLPPAPLVLLLLVSTSCLVSAGSDDRRELLAYVPARRRARDGGGADCRAMASRSKCLERSDRCRWCRSDALDDMCFGSGEAWRLPHQIFSCEAPSA